jgi:hypothetical protein
VCIPSPASKETKITKISVRSRSKRPIIAVTLGWRLFYCDSPEKTLVRGESPLLSVTLNQSERRDIEFPLVRFAKISKSFMQNGRLDGNFKIEIRVTRALFEDSQEQTSMLSNRGSSLVSAHPESNTKEAIARVTNYPSAILPIRPCGNTACKWDGSCYTCQPQQGLVCDDSQGCTWCSIFDCVIG